MAEADPTFRKRHVRSESLVPKEIERVFENEISTSRHYFVEENGTQLKITGKERRGDEVLLMLAGGTSRMWPASEKIPVVERDS